MNSLTELKKIIQSINEAITDDDIDAFQKHISQLGQQYENNPPVTSLLKMMQSLATYLGSRKQNAHADSIPVLNSIAEQLDKIINTPDLEKDETQRILWEEIQKYKSLKNNMVAKPAINDKDINDLKTAILAMDWEISDTTLQNFETVVTSLLLKSKSHKIHHTFLKIIHGTGRSIGIQKANAPADATSFLRSVFENFERVTQTPDMAFQDKKQILETDINRFHEFKHKISSKKEPIQHITTDTSEEDHDDIVQPALSHIKSSRPATDDMIPLTLLPEHEETPLTGIRPEPGTIEPALTGRRNPSTGPRDVMDDLFSIKASPSDELLDEIHLMDVHGPNPDQALNMLNQTADFQSDGIKNFTPKRLNNDPIPEIGTRLDEFFNLDVAEKNRVATEDLPNDPPENPPETPKDHTIELISLLEDDPVEGIVPFQYEDESFEEKPLPQNPDSVILRRLKSTIETPGWMENRSSMIFIDKDIAYLENRWQTDPDKTGLLQIIISTIHLLKNQSENIDTGKSVSDFPRNKPLGIWGKIKGLFSS